MITPNRTIASWRGYNRCMAMRTGTRARLRPQGEYVQVQRACVRGLLGLPHTSFIPLFKFGSLFPENFTHVTGANALQLSRKMRRAFAAAFGTRRWRGGENSDAPTALFMIPRLAARRQARELALRGGLPIG